jgi:ubiquinone/menaquinone biosynthesis C-methylase UbiE
MVSLRRHPVVAAALPVGSRRRRVVASIGRRVLGTPSTTASPKRAPRIAKEEQQLRKAWVRHRSEMLDVYLVSGYQDPRLNIQSILGRHMLVRALFGSAFESLMQEELAFAVELNEEMRVRARELGVSLGVTMDAERRAGMQRVMEPIDPKASTYAHRWREALEGRRARPLRVVELACGSANDYRAFVDYGIARFLDYTGFDLNPKNVANAKERFPDVDFREGSILSLPLADRSVHYVVAFDILEHLSLQAMQQALDEAVRVARRGLYIAFFRMAEAPEHVEQPRGHYHYNTLSAPRMRSYLEQRYSSVDLVSVDAYLQQKFGYSHTHNRMAYSVVAKDPVGGRRAAALHAVRRLASAQRR